MIDPVEAAARAMQGANALMALRDMPWDDCDPREREHWLDLARSCVRAYLATKQPSEEMLKQAYASQGGVKDQWHAMRAQEIKELEP